MATLLVSFDVDDRKIWYFLQQVYVSFSQLWQKPGLLLEVARLFNPDSGDAQFAAVGSIVEFNVDQTSILAGFSFQVEAVMTAGPAGDVIQSIELWNEQDQVWDWVDTRAAANRRLLFVVRV